MDEIVIRGTLKWPSVPAVYGWLALDKRGGWRIKSVSGRFQPIANSALKEFIGRNYAADARGRWYFQNGPQRVFVALDYTPWVYRLDDSCAGLMAHNDAVPRDVEAVFLDDCGTLLLKTEIGVGVVLDRDLGAILQNLTGVRGGTAERLLADASRGAQATAILFGRRIRVASVCRADVPRLFGFVQRPSPAPGIPDCA